MKKLLLTALIAAMMALPLGTVAMADDKPISESPRQNAKDSKNSTQKVNNF